MLDKMMESINNGADGTSVIDNLANSPDIVALDAIISQKLGTPIKWITMMLLKM